MKYTILMSCGHEDTVELFGKNVERERKIEYYKTYGLCKECYKAHMEEQQKKEEFVFKASVLPMINDKNGEIRLYVWFEGNTKPYKDDIKALGGYRWDEKQDATDFLSLKKPGLCWGKTIDMKDLETEVKKAQAIGAEDAVTNVNLFSAAHCAIALEKHNEWIKNAERIAAIPKPEEPEILAGHKWNQKIYGKEGNYSIFPDGQKVMITNEEAKAIREYLKNKEEYNGKVKEIQNA